MSLNRNPIRFKRTKSLTVLALLLVSMVAFIEITSPPTAAASIIGGQGGGDTLPATVDVSNSTCNLCSGTVITQSPVYTPLPNKIGMDLGPLTTTLRGNGEWTLTNRNGNNLTIGAITITDASQSTPMVLRADYSFSNSTIHAYHFMYGRTVNIWEYLKSDGYSYTITIVGTLPSAGTINEKVLSPSGTASDCDTDNIPNPCMSVSFGSETYSWAGDAQYSPSFNNATGTLTYHISSAQAPSFFIDPIALDGTGSATTGTGGATASSVTATLSTSNTNDIIVAIVYNFAGGGQTISSVTSTGLTFYARTGSLGEYDSAEYYAVSTGTLSTASIKATISSATYLSLIVFGISDANLGNCASGGTTCFDPESSLPYKGATGTQTANPSVTATTTNADDLILGIGTLYQTNIAVTTTASWASGFTIIGGIVFMGQSGSNLPAFSLGYDVVTSTQSSVSFHPLTWSVTTYSILAIDAFQQASASAFSATISPTLSLAPSTNLGLKIPVFPSISLLPLLITSPSLRQEHTCIVSAMSSPTCAFSSSVISGDEVYVEAVNTVIGDTVSSVTDSVSNSYSQVVASNTYSAGDAEGWCSVTTTGGTITVTVNYVTPVTGAIFVNEVANANGCNVDTSTGGAAILGSSPVVRAYSPSYDSLVIGGIVVGCAFGTCNLAAGSGYTLDNSVGAAFQAGTEHILNYGTTETTPFAITGIISSSYNEISVAFEPVGFLASEIEATLTLSSSINEALGLIVSAALTLSTSVNEALGVLLSDTINLIPSLSVTLQSAYSAMLSAVIILAPSVNEGLGVVVHPALALDGSNINYGCSGTSTCATTLTTTYTNDLIIVSISTSCITGSCTPPAVSSVTASGLTFTYRAASGTGGNYWDNEEWYAIAPTILSGETITANFPSNFDTASIIVFGVSGANIANPFDGCNSGAAVVATSGVGGSANPTVNCTTGNSNDMIIGLTAYAGFPPAAGAGYTEIQDDGGNAPYQDPASEYKIVTATQSALPINFINGATDGWVIIGDAIQQAPGLEISLSPFINQAFTVAQSSSISLSGSINEALGILLSGTISLTSSLSAIFAYIVNLSTTLTLGASINVALGVLISGTIGLVALINQNLNSLISATISLTSSINQALRILLSGTISLSASVSALFGYYVTLSSTISLSASINVALGVLISGAISISSSINQTLTSLVSSTISLTASINQALGILLSGTISLTPSLSAILQYIINLSASISLSASVNIALGIIISGALNLTSSISQNINALTSATIGLTAFVNQALGIILSQSISLSASLSALFGYFATLSASISLSASINEALGVLISDTISLAASISQAPNTLISATISLVSSVNQALGVTLSQSITLLASLSAIFAYYVTISTSISLSASLNTALGILVSSAINLTGSINQALRVTLSDTINLTPTVSAIISGLYATLSVTIALSSSVNQSLSILLSDIISLTVSMSQIFGVLLSGTISLTSSVNQALGILLSDTINISPSVVALLNGFYATLSATIALSASVDTDLGVMIAGAITLASSINQSLVVLASYSIGLSSSINQALGILLSDTINLTPSVMAILSGFYATLSATIALSASVNTGLGILLSDTISLTSSMTQNLSDFVSATISLTGSVNQGLGILLSDSLSLIPSLSAIMSGFYATLSAVITLTPSLNQGLGILVSDSVTLVGTFDQDLGTSVSSSINLVASLNQGIGITISESITLLASLSAVMSGFYADLSATIALSSSVNISLGIIISETISLMSAIDQDLGVIISYSITLTASLSAVVQSAYSAMLSAAIALQSSINVGLGVGNNPTSPIFDLFIGLTASVDQDLGIFQSVTITLTSSLDQDLGLILTYSETLSASVSATVNAFYSATLDAALSLTANVDQDLGLLVYDTTSLMTSVGSGMTSVVSQTIGLSNSINQGLGVNLSQSISLLASLMAVFTGSYYATLAATESLIASVNQGLGLLVSGNTGLTVILGQGFESKISQSIQLTGSIDQDLGVTLSSIINLGLTLMIGGNHVYTEMLSVGESLLPCLVYNGIQFGYCPAVNVTGIPAQGDIDITSIAVAFVLMLFAIGLLVVFKRRYDEDNIEELVWIQ